MGTKFAEFIAEFFYDKAFKTTNKRYRLAYLMAYGALIPEFHLIQY